MSISTKICLLFTAMSILAACGHRGDLERPPPLWGKNKVEQPSNIEEQEAEIEESIEPQVESQYR